MFAVLTLAVIIACTAIVLRDVNSYERTLRRMQGLSPPRRPQSTHNQS